MSHLNLPAVRLSLVSAYLFHEGIIGVGKSTLLRPFCEQLADALQVDRERIIAVQEPVEQWRSVGALDAFYNDIRGESMPFQHFTHVTRLQSYIDAVMAVPERFFLEPQRGITVVLACERSIVADGLCFMRMLCAGGFVLPHHISMYQAWWATWSHLMPLRHMAFIYWRPRFEVVMQRMKQRNRDAEVSAVDVDYQRRLAEQHELVFGVADQTLRCDPATLMQQWRDERKRAAAAESDEKSSGGASSSSPASGSDSGSDVESDLSTGGGSGAVDSVAAKHRSSPAPALEAFTRTVLPEPWNVFVADNSGPKEQCAEWLAPAVEFAVREIRTFASNTLAGAGSPSAVVVVPETEVVAIATN